MVEQTSATGAIPLDSQSLQQSYVLQQQLSSGAQWFWAIAGLSVINSLITLAGGEWTFIIGLGVTQIIDGVAQMIAAEATANTGTILQGLGFGLDLVIITLFALFGWFGKQGYRWAFIIGMLLYTFDGLIFLFLQSWISVGFHVFALFSLYNGLTAANKLRSIH